MHNVFVYVCTALYSGITVCDLLDRHINHITMRRYVAWYAIDGYIPCMQTSTNMHTRHSISNQQKKSQPFWIFMKFGTDMDSTKKLSLTKIWLILLISLQDMTT